MEKLSISSVSRNIFRAAPKNIENNQTNPFGVSFKGNVLTADVFEKNKNASKINFTGIASIKSKMLSSAIVGSINDFSSAIASRLDSVVSFGRRIKENASILRARAIDGWNKADAWWEEIRTKEVMDLVKSGISKLRNNYDNLAVSELELRLKDNLAMIK